jgi:hypothetical protein
MKLLIYISKISKPDLKKKKTQPMAWDNVIWSLLPASNH